MKTLGPLLTIAYRNVWRNGRRTALCVIAVAIAVFFNIYMRSWIEGMFNSIEEVVRTYETGHILAVSSNYEADKEYFPVQFPLADGRPAEDLIREAEALPHVRAALPRIMTYGSLFDSSVKHALLWGIDTEKERTVNVFNLTKRDDGIIQGRYPAMNTNECMVGMELARKANLKIGDRIPLKTVSAQFSDKYLDPTIVGIFKFDYGKFDENVIVFPIDRLSRFLVMEGSTQQLFIYLDKPENTAPVIQALKAMWGPKTVLHDWKDNYWVAMLNQMTFLYYIIYGVFQIVASFLIINTILMVIHERIKEIGMMGALGMSRREITEVFFFEALILSILGSLAGCAVGALVSWISSLFPLDLTWFTGGGLKDMPMSGTLFIAFSWKIIAWAFGFGVLVSACCTLIPSLKSAFVEPVEALRR